MPYFQSNCWRFDSKAPPCQTSVSCWWEDSNPFSFSLSLFFLLLSILNYTSVSPISTAASANQHILLKFPTGSVSIGDGFFLLTPPRLCLKRRAICVSPFCAASIYRLMLSEFLHWLRSRSEDWQMQFFFIFIVTLLRIFPVITFPSF